jgi:hypothetical protein
VAAATSRDMYLLDGSGEPASPPADAMPRGTPPRKTVYRISVTMVRKEQLTAPGSRGADPRPARRPRPARSPDAPGRLVEEAEETADDEDREGRQPCSWDFRTFRTRSTGQLELGRLRPCTRNPEPTDLAGSPTAVEGPGSPAPGSPGVEGTGAAPLRRSLSFRHWSGPEASRDPALDGGRHHSSSGSLAWAPSDEAEADPETALEPPAAAQPASEKRNTLDVGEVLSKNDALSDLERWERSKSKNRTLDNSDLQRLERARAAAAGSGAGPGAGPEHRLLRFFSGIFARRDGAPGGPSPRSGGSRSRGYFSSLRRAPADAHSSSAESIDGSPRRGGHPGQWALGRFGEWWELAQRSSSQPQGAPRDLGAAKRPAIQGHKPAGGRAALNSHTVVLPSSAATSWMFSTAPDPGFVWSCFSGETSPGLSAMYVPPSPEPLPLLRAFCDTCGAADQASLSAGSCCAGASPGQEKTACLLVCPHSPSQAQAARGSYHLWCGFY